MLGWSSTTSALFRIARVVLRFVLVLVLAITVVVAGARPARADEAAARVHFKRGIELYDRKAYPEALAAFQDAYREKPSAGIKQNIALSLKGMGKLAEAATAFDEALDEGKDTLKPDTRAAIERELTELSRSVATVLLTVTADDKPAPGATITIEPAGEPARTLPVDAHKRPIRLLPGVYTFTARAPGYPEPAPKKLALVSGAPTDASFILGGSGSAIDPGVPGQQGKLTVRASVDEAALTIDGKPAGRGTWTGTIAAGSHTIEAAAPSWRTTKAEVVVSPGATIDYPIELTPIGDAPPEYRGPGGTVPKKKRFYVALNAGVHTVSYRLTQALGEVPPYGSRRGNFGGGAIGFRFGALLFRPVAIELATEIGSSEAKYHVAPNTPESKTRVTHFDLAPLIRFASPGKIRFTGATGFGIHAIKVEAETRAGHREGEGFAFVWLLDGGFQADIGPVYFEAVLFLAVHGVGTVRDDAPPEGRFFFASPATRGGARIGVGIPF
jgi:hypothetical protein